MPLHYAQLEGQNQMPGKDFSELFVKERFELGTIWSTDLPLTILNSYTLKFIEVNRH